MIETALERPDSSELAQHCADLFGVYVHVPFCHEKCAYCDFASFEGMSELADRYVERVCAEIAQSGTSRCDTAYVGGGTPTVLSPSQLQRLMEAIPTADLCELTVEANPESLNAAMAEAIASAGANRISIGMQSSSPELLDQLGRLHSPGSVDSAVREARSAGICRINLDLIYGMPEESTADWEASLLYAIELDPGHISAYALTLEPGTPMWRDVRAGRREGPNDDDQAEKMRLADEQLSGAGYVRYEVAAWAKPGHECRHNLMYWGGGRYRGFGSGAHSYIGGRRFWNHRHPDSYLSQDDWEPSGSELISAEVERFDRISLGMRRAAGIALADLPDHAGKVIAMLEEAGLACAVDGHLRPTSRGFALGSEVAIRLLSVLDAEC